MSNLGNELTCRSYWMESYYEPFSIRAIAALSYGLDAFMDVGSNVGVFALFAASLPRVPRVFAFEPNPRVRCILEMNRDINHFAIDVSPVALSDSIGEAEFFEPESVTSGSLNEDFNADVVDRYTVATSTLDELFAESPDLARGPGKILIKMDVLGHESAVLRGGHAFTRKFLPIYLLEAVRDYDADEVGFLRDLGYRFYLILPAGLEEVTTIEGRDVDGYRFANIIATTDEKVSRTISSALREASSSTDLEETSLHGFAKDEAQDSSLLQPRDKVCAKVMTETER